MSKAPQAPAEGSRMTSMVEKVARAIYDADTHGMNKMSNYTPEDMLDAARAAIAAMREPTQKMRKSGATACDEYLTDPDGTELHVWHAMIDAILSEHGG